MTDYRFLEIDGPADGIMGVEGVAYVEVDGTPSWGSLYDGSTPDSVGVELPVGATVVGWRCSREVRAADGHIVDVPYYVDFHGKPIWEMPG